jgi:hypothetical protein
VLAISWPITGTGMYLPAAYRHLLLKWKKEKNWQKLRKIYFKKYTAYQNKNFTTEPVFLTNSGLKIITKLTPGPELYCNIPVTFLKPPEHI